MTNQIENIVHRKPEEMGLDLMMPMGRVLSAETSQWLMSLVEKAAKKELSDGRKMFIISAREGFSPVLITGVIDRESGEVTGAIWFGNQGNLPQKLDVSWTMLGQQHHLMQTMPEMVDGMCDLLEHWFVSGAGKDNVVSSMPEPLLNSLGEVAKMYDQQQAGEAVTIIHSSPERGVLDEARIMGVQGMPSVVNGAVAKAVKLAFGL